MNLGMKKIRFLKIGFFRNINYNYRLCTANSLGICAVESVKPRTTQD